MRVIVVVLLCVFFVASSHAQALKGSVRDSAGKPVSNITVSLKSRSGIISYTVTDNKGVYSLHIPVDGVVDSLTVEARGFGYKTMVQRVTTFDAPLDFILTESVSQLQEVVVKSSRPVLRTHGDTLSYKVSEFANPQDRTIGEVIKKLPGITVDANGTIRYNNQAVSAVYLAGDNLLDDKYTIATNSIPQGAVNQVQVIQNNQPIKALQNKVLSEEVALNLEFKKTAKLHLMGQENIAVGLPGNYDVNLNAMMLKNNYKAINYLGANNIGYDVQRDLVSHNMAEYLKRIDNATPDPLLSLGSVITPALAQNRYLFNQSKVVNLNNLVHLDKNVQLKINAYYVHDTQKQEYSQQTKIYLPTDTVRYNEHQQNRSVPDIFHTQFTLNINRDKYYLDNILLMDHKNVTNYSGLQTDSAALNQVWKDQAHNFSNEFNLIRTLGPNKMIQAYSFISHSSEPEKLSIDPGYNASIFNHNVPYAQLVQQADVPGWYTNNYVSLKIPSGLITQSYKAGFSYQSQTLNSNLNILQNDGSMHAPSDSATNHVNWTKNKWYTEAAYDLVGEKLKAKLVLPLTLQQIDYSENAYALHKSLSRFYFNPQLNTKWQVSAENYVNLSYSYRNQIGSIENVYPGLILTNYRTLYANSAQLTEQQIQQLSGGFSYRKALKLFFWNINAMYVHTGANNIESSIIANNIQKGIVLPYPNSTESWAVNGSVSKYVFALRTTFSGVIGRQSTHSVQIQNNALLPFHTISETLDLSADTKISNTINVHYKAGFMQISSRSTAEVSAFHIDQLTQEASIHYNPMESLQFKLSGEHYFTRQQGSPDLAYFFADASLKFRVIKWKTDLEFSAVNFLNLTTYRALYLSANTFTASSYQLPGRIVMMRVMFNF